MFKRFLYIFLIGLVIFLTKPIYSFSNVNEEDHQNFFLKTLALIVKYEKQLGFYANPFAHVFDTEEANSVYKSLLSQEGDFFCEDSYFFKITLELLKNPRDFNLNLIREFLIEAENALEDNTSKTRKKQSHLLGLKILLPYLSTFVEKEQQNQKQDEIKEPKWPQESSDSYKPHTKDMGNDQDSKNKTIITKVNFKTPVFGRTIYDTIIRDSNSPFQVTDLPWLTGSPPVAKDGLTNEHMTVYPLGKRELKLFMPPGYRPALPNASGATIKPTKGGYLLLLEKDFEELNIPLHKTQSSQLNEHLKNIYTRPVGISRDEIPEKLQVAVIHKFDPEIEHQTTEVAHTLANHLAKDYLYSLKARPETDPIAALTAGAFQCDMAAYIMVAILRDIYKIPSRVVAGYRAKRANNNKEMWSYLLTPEEGHAWVEVFTNGNWLYFDPTPTKKDQEDENDKKEQQDFSDWDEDEDSTDDDSTNDKPDEKKSTHTKERETKQEEVSDGGEEDSNTDNPFLFPELDQKLLDLLLEEEQETNPIKRVAWEDILIYTLNPLKSSYDIQNRIHAYKNVFKYVPKLDDLLAEAKEIHTVSHDPLLKWLGTLSNKIFNQEINDTYKDLIRMIQILEIYQKVSDRSDIKQLIFEINNLIEDIIKILDKLNSEVALDMAMVDDFKNNSPSLLWKSLRKEYNLSVIGPNLPTQNLAQDIRDGKLNDKKLINALYGYTDFILNSSFQPGRTEVKTWQQGSLTRGRDILPLTQFSDWRNAIMMRPDLDIVGNIEQKTAYLLTNRKKILTESAKKPNEAQRITIVGFDTSGSMSSGLDQFQAALITAFACRAIDDVTPSGKHRHKIVLVPFDDQIGTPMRINNNDDVLNLITNHKSWLRNTGGGTDIQKFLLEALSLIAEAQTNTKTPLDIANIIVMSDGQSNIDYETLRKARNAIHRDTPIQAMFVALGSTNSELQRFAQDAKQMGMNSENLYRSFSYDEIQRIMEKLKQNDLQKYKNAFYSLKKPEDIDPNNHIKIIELFNKIIEKTKQLDNKISSRIIPSKKPNTHKRDLDIKTRTISKKTHQERKIEAWLHEFREWVKKYEIHKDPKLFELILDDLMINFEKLLGVKFGELAHYELEQLNHLLQTGEEN